MYIFKQEIFVFCFLSWRIESSLKGLNGGSKWSLFGWDNIHEDLIYIFENFDCTPLVIRRSVFMFMRSAAVRGWGVARGGRPSLSCCGRAWPGWSSSPRPGYSGWARDLWRRTPSVWCLSRRGSWAHSPPSSRPSTEQEKWVRLKT